MNSSIRKYILIVGMVILSINILTIDSKTIPEKSLFRIIRQGLEAWHYSGKKVDNDFSKQGLNEYLSILDFNKRFFLKSDILVLNRYRDRIDDELKEGDPELMNLAVKTINSRITGVLSMINKILSHPFSYNIDEEILFSPENRKYFNSKDEQRDYWRKLLKYNTLTKYLKLTKEKKKNPIPMIPELERKARESVKKSFNSRLQRRLKTNTKDAVSLFLNSMVRVFDPHTTYFSPKNLEDLDIDMTGKLEGIGALLGEKDGYITIVRIIPGGPSWKEKSLKAGDKILKVAQGDNEPVDIVGIRTIDAVKFIRGKKGTLVKLTVLKPDGTTKIVSIVRDVVIIEETFAKSTLIKDKITGKNFGYIFLPGFYNDFSDNKGRKSSKDVLKEIKILKNKNIEGLILDLRNNSGGALKDAITLSGFFIDNGPVLQTKNRNTGIRILDDPSSGVEYDKPLVVLVNSMSASASEIVAGALQDYKRAVIVGGLQSFGKGTVQILIDLNKFMRKRSDDSLGAFKVTIQIFYRITGVSNQYTGIIPDIILPDYYDYLKIGERYYKHPLRAEKIKPLKFNNWNYNGIDINKIKKLSSERVLKSKGFNKINNYIKRLKESESDKQFNLRIDKLIEKQKKFNIEKDNIDKNVKYLKDFSLISTLANRLFKSEKLKKIAKENEKHWFEQLEKDIQLKESLMILKDMVRLEGARN